MPRTRSPLSCSWTQPASVVMEAIERTWGSSSMTAWWRWAIDQRRGMLKSKASMSSSAARAVLTLRQVLKGASCAFGVEGEVAVHHRGDAEGSVGLGDDAVAPLDIGDESGVGVLEAFDGGEGVGPQAVDELVLPGVSAGGEDLVLGADEDGFDAREPN